MDRNTKKRTQHYAITLWWSSNAYKIKFAQQEGYYNILYIMSQIQFSELRRQLVLVCLDSPVQVVVRTINSLADWLMTTCCVLTLPPSLLVWLVL